MLEHRVHYVWESGSVHLWRKLDAAPDDPSPPIDSRKPSLSFEFQLRRAGLTDVEAAAGRLRAPHIRSETRRLGVRLARLTLVRWLEDGSQVMAEELERKSLDDDQKRSGQTGRGRARARKRKASSPRRR